MLKNISYQYRHLPIPGGGYVTGFLFHPKEKGLLYARTDIGGTYRFDRKSERWVSLISHVTHTDLSETFPIALALDEHYPERLYIACGEYQSKYGTLAFSEDYGESFQYRKLPAFVHGNLGGRGTGERLIVDGQDSNTLYFASQQNGLWVSNDRGNSWRRLDAMKEQYLTFVGQIGEILLVGTAGVTLRASETMRGHSLYVSYDKGASFLPLEEPESNPVQNCKLNGLVAQRYSVDASYLYVTFAANGRYSRTVENGYSCDSGDSRDGHVVRYSLKTLEQGLGVMEDITPEKGQVLEYGFSGICASRQTPGLLVATTLVKGDGDSVFLSLDYGTSWQQILYDLQVGNLCIRTPYMKPEYNGGHSIIHWLSDIKLNPADDNEVWFNTGTGVFRSVNLRSEQRVFTDWCDGIEETVHLNVYSMPEGDVQVIDMVGDLGGFAFQDVDRPCENSFADAQNNHYITCINADFSDEQPQVLLVTPRGNWTGKTKGGLILSRDQGKSFRQLPMPYGLSPEIDQALRHIEQPNINSGWAAMSPDTKNIVWSIAFRIFLPVELMVVSQDGGQSFMRCEVYKADGSKKDKGSVKVFSDRMDSSLFYGFGDNSELYVSRDGGKSFWEYSAPKNFPIVDFGRIDGANKTEIRGEAGKSGVFYVATGSGGLWKLYYNKEKDQLEGKRLSQEGDSVFRIGLGIGSPKGNYTKDPKAIYFNGIIGGEYGFYRTLDDGKTLVRINTQKQMFGQINSIDGDCRVFGRFYLATGSCGLLYGEPLKIDYYDTLQNYVGSGIYPMHMPGHKRRTYREVLRELYGEADRKGKAGAWQEPALLSAMMQLDVTEVPGVDDLHHPESALKTAMEQAALLYGADSTYFLVNGSTCGNLAALEAVTNFGDKVLIARNCHKSVYNGMLHRGLIPYYVYPQYIKELGINGPVLPEDVEKTLEQQPDIRAVVIVSPTYDGVVSDIQSIGEIVHRYQIPLIVDEAHGAHFPYCGEMVSALQQGADIVIQSVHKTLPALTQAALLHVKSQYVSKRKLEQALQLFESSSPSYLLVASIDSCISFMSRFGKDLADAFCKKLDFLYKSCEKLKEIYIYPYKFGCIYGILKRDASKVLIGSRHRKLSGAEIEVFLREQGGIQIEMSTPLYGLALLSPFDSMEGIQRLVKALFRLDEAAEKAEATVYIQEEKELQLIPAQVVMTPYEAQIQDWEETDLRAAAGRISWDTLYIYPPGIPLAVPGEKITSEMIAQMTQYMDSGFELQGLTADGRLRTVK